MSAIDIDALREEALATDEGKQFAQGYEVICRGVAFRCPPVAMFPLSFFRLQREGDQYGALEVLFGRDLAVQLTDAGLVLDDLERIVTSLPRPGGVQGPPSRKSSAPGS
jgi:hypothetical protein